LGVSSIHGVGLFAAEHIPAGTVVWRNLAEAQLVLDVDRVEWLEVAHPVYAAFIKKHAFLRRFSQAAYAHYVLCLDDSRFMNHSDTANLTEDPESFDSVANRDILVGEELTCNYREFDADVDIKLSGPRA
jgi:SET domain-containing protein